MAITAETRQDIMELAVAANNAAPGTTLLSDLVAMSTSGKSLLEIADSLASSASFVATYPTFQTATEFATEFLGNLVPEASAAAVAEGVTIIEGMLAAGDSRGKVILEAATYLAALDEADASFGTSAALFNHRVEVATYHTITSEAAAPWDIPASVTSSDDSVATGKGAVDTALSPAAAAPDAAQSISLTTGIDVKTGGTGNDSFNALPTTLTTGDVLDGGDGSDTLVITASLTAAASTLGFRTSNIEALNVNVVDGDATAAHALTVNMLDSDIGTVNVSGTSATTQADGVVLTNVDSGTSVKAVGTTNVDLTVTYDAAFLAGAGDAATLTLQGNTYTAAADNDITYTAGIETLTVDSLGSANKIGDLVWGGAALVVTGDQNLTINDALAATANNIDASAFTGKLAVSVANTTDKAAVAGVDVLDQEIKGGSGNDTITTAGDTGLEVSIEAGAGDDTVTIAAVPIKGSATLAADKLDGGDGNDTLVMTTALANSAAAANNVTTSNFETLKVSDANTNSITLKNIQAGLAQINLAAGSNGGTTVFAAGADNKLTIGAANAGAYTATDTGTATTDALTINTKTTATVDMGNNNAFTFTGLETVTFDTTTKAAADMELDVSTITMTADTGGTDTLNVTGTGTFHASGAITAEVIDFSGMDTSGHAATVTIANMGAAAVGVTTITGSAGKDILVGDAKSTINGGGGNDTITGGSGNDTLNGGDGNDGITTNAGNDTVNGGAGNDTITVAGNLTGADKIDGGDGTDTLSATNASLTALAGLTISEANTFNANFNNVEVLTLTDALNQTSFDLGYLSGVNSVKLADITGAETLAGFDSGGTLTLTETLTDTLTATVNSAATGTADSFTIKLVASADDDYTAVTVANIETITVDVTETTASANSRTATIGLTTAQATGGGAQTLNIVGTEDLVIDTTVTVGTIDASGMSARTATTPGLVMTGAAHSKAQTITGSSGADTIIGSSKADTINLGAGNDSVTAGLGGDTLDGGTGTDTYIATTALTAANIEGTGTGTSTGLVVNLGASALTNAAILGATGQDISGQLTEVAAGSVVYLFNGSAPTNSNVTDTISNFENVTLADGINYINGSASANTIVGGSGVDTIVAGNGADSVTGGGAADTITLTETTANSAADTVIYTAATAANIATETGATAGTDNDFAAGSKGDKIVGFTSGKDKIQFATALTNNGTDTDTLKSIAAGGTVANNDIFVEITTDAANGQMGTHITMLNALTTSDVAIGEDVVFFISDGTDGYLYLLTQVSAADTIAAQDVTLIGQLTGVTDIADGDLVSG